LTINNGKFALAGKSASNDRVVIAFPAEAPESGMDTVKLIVQNLPWGGSGYYVYRYELTEQSYASGIKYNLTYTSSGNGTTVSDTLSYPSNGNSGRLILWEITSSPITTVKDIPLPENPIVLSPNPTNGTFYIQIMNNDIKISAIRIFSLAGQEIYHEEYSDHTSKTKIHTPLQNGMYTVVAETNKGVFTSTILVLK
jgi:hypothetical protein